MHKPWRLDVAGCLTALVVVASSAQDNSEFSLRHQTAGPFAQHVVPRHAATEELSRSTSLSRPEVPKEAFLEHLRQSRGLQGGPSGPCIMMFIQFEEGDTIQKWADCITEKEKTADARIAGTSYAIRQQCWCENNVQEVLDQYGCCRDPDFALYCQAECNPSTCDTPAIQKCIQDCPAACLESDYAPEFCVSGCQPCWEHMLCITGHSKNMTTKGHADHPYHCDDTGFNESPQWKAWSQCYADLPKRTHWHRHNAQNHCFCAQDLKAAAQQHKCCGSSWGKPICDEQCATAQSSFDCNSAEAKGCMDTCNQACSQLFTEDMVPDCKAKCFDESSRCAKYSVCKPAGPYSFNYLCDDGSPPAANGCCGPVGRCPSLCEGSSGYLFPHGLECQCLGCPENPAEGKKKFAKTLQDDFDAHGVSALASISKEVGILGANRKMQELMKERNDAITKAFDEHPGGVDDAWNRKAAQIVYDYRELIVAEAQAFKARGEKDEVGASGTSATNTMTGNGTANWAAGGPSGPPAGGNRRRERRRKKGDDDDDGSIVIIAAAVSGVVAIAMCIGFFVVYRAGKAKGSKEANSANPGSGMGSINPVDGDSNVVMGRPVQGEGVLVGAAQGAPVALGGSSDGPEKGGDGAKSV